MDWLPAPEEQRRIRWYDVSVARPVLDPFPAVRQLRGHRHLSSAARPHPSDPIVPSLNYWVLIKLEYNRLTGRVRGVKDRTRPALQSTLVIDADRLPGIGHCSLADLVVFPRDSSVRRSSATLPLLLRRRGHDPRARPGDRARGHE